jgi:hypothetical protein
LPALAYEVPFADLPEGTFSQPVHFARRLSIPNVLRQASFFDAL